MPGNSGSTVVVDRPRVLPLTPLTSDRLESWKAIASFFGREVRTVQLWEQHEALPVHRHFHRRQGSVYAYKSELQAWKDASSIKPESTASPAVMPSLVGRPAASPTRMARALAGYRIGVLALECIDGDTDQQRLSGSSSPVARAIHQELVVELCRRNLQPLELAHEVEGQACNSRAILSRRQRELHLGGILAGSLRREGNRLRISVQLLVGEQLRCVWAERFDSDTSFEGQAAIASTIVSALPLRELASPAHARPALASGGEGAQNACVLGRHFWEQRNGAALRKAEQYFKQAIALDASCSQAYAGLADCYVSYSYSHLMPSGRAQELANRALALALPCSDGSASIHNSVANVMLSCNWDWAAAERQCTLACEDHPENSRGLQLYSMYMVAQQRHEEGTDLAMQAFQLNPLSKVLSNEVAYAYYYSGDFEEALPFSHRAVELDSDFVMGYALIGMIQTELGHWDEAVAAIRDAMRLSNHASFTTALLAYTNARMGEQTHARELLNAAMIAGSDRCFPSMNMAAAHAAIGEKDAALLCLRRARRERDVQMMALASDPRFYPVRSTPEFREIVSSIKLA